MAYYGVNFTFTKNSYDQRFFFLVSQWDFPTEIDEVEVNLFVR